MIRGDGGVRKEDGGPISRREGHGGLDKWGLEGGRRRRRRKSYCRKGNRKKGKSTE